jgi:putative ABC transport system substrate-binding protein
VLMRWIPSAISSTLVLDRELTMALLCPRVTQPGIHRDARGVIASRRMNGRRGFLVGVAAFATFRAPAVLAQASLPRVGLVSAGGPSVDNSLTGLRELGHVPGETIVVEHRPTAGEADRYDAAVASVLAAGVDVLVVTSPHGIVAARRRTSRVPIVAVDLESDPVASGYITSLARPGSNLTGLFLDLPEMSAKLLQLLQELKRGLSRVGIIWDAAIARTQFEATERAARAAGIDVHPAVIRTAVELEPAIEGFVRERTDAVIALSSPLIRLNQARIDDLGVRHRLPSITVFPLLENGRGLLSYGPDLHSMHRRAAVYVDRILKGASVAEMPVERPAKFELAVNLRTAKSLGLELPQSLLLRADRVLQ